MNIIFKIQTQAKITILVFCVSVVAGCKKIIDVNPPTTSITQENVFTDDFTATAVLNGLYTAMQNSSIIAPSFTTFSKMLGLSSDELNLWSGADAVHQAYFKNSLKSGINASSNAGHEFWNEFYLYIYRCNASIEGISKSSTLSESAKRQLLGEARFMRAFFYFYLVNLYGDVPLVISTDVEVNRLISRSSKNLVYKFIEEDLLMASDELSEVYLDGTLKVYSGASERVRPTKWAAKALLSRVYLYIGEWANAEQSATEVIQSTLFSMVDVNSAFLKNNNEAVWQLQPVGTGWNTSEARIYNLAAPPAGFNIIKNVFLASQMISAFESGDKRNISWVGTYTEATGTYYFANKYKNATQSASITTPGSMTEYITILRLAEQYLIRAEARIQQNNIPGGINDLNVLRSRARAVPTMAIPNPLPALSQALSKVDALLAVLQERRIELFAEFGHRWLDLKRTTGVDLIMPPITTAKGGSWESTDALYPLPFTELQRNPNLIQNLGY